MQTFIHSPTSFICRYADKLLPDWQCKVASVLIVLQHPSCDLLGRTHYSEVQKNRLRERFLAFGGVITSKLKQMGYSADLFDPKTGQPVLSTPGQFWLDDVAVVCACLGYSSIQVSGCSVIMHPDWGSAVYPSVLVSSAPPAIVERVVNSIVGTASDSWKKDGWGGSEESDSTWRSLSEYHHSFIGCGSFTQ